MPLWLLQFAASLILSFIGSLIQEAQKENQSKPGVRGNVSIGGEEPLSFIIGRYGSAGHRVYLGTWGSDGDTPNAYLTDVIEYSNLPIRGFEQLYVYGEKVTLGPTPHPLYGYPVLEYRQGSKDYLWAKLYTGSQTSADPLCVAKFGSDPDRPYDASMVGRGTAYIVWTARLNRELFSGRPEYFADMLGYDIPGENPDNPVALIRQVMRGFFYDGDWVWGLQNLPATRLPDQDGTQADKCDVTVDKLDGGTEPRYRAGLEVKVDQEPADIIDELLKSCSGRIAEVGGKYKLLVGEPGTPVMSFTDDDIVITEGQSLDPWPGLERTYNGVGSTYPEPDEKWGMKPAPDLIDETLELADDDRRLMASIRYNAVYSVTQVQRLNQEAHRESRRFRNHTMTLPPEWWEYEVLDPVEWSSDRFSYENKGFIITMMDDLPNGNQFVGVKEQDNSDFVWDPETDEQESTPTPITVQRPAPQLVTSPQALPATILDSDGSPRRPSIEITYPAGLVDVRAIRVQVRLPGDTVLAYDGEIPYDPNSDVTSSILNGVFLPAQAYEVRYKYLPYSGRVTRWSNEDEDGVESAWLGVTTPDVRLGADDINIELDAIADQVNQQIAAATSSIRLLRERLEQTGRLASEADLASYDQWAQLSRSVTVQLGELSAGFRDVVEVALGPGGSVATRFEEVYASLGGSTSSINVRWDVEAGPAGYASRLLLQAAVDDGNWRGATLMMDVPSNPLEKTQIVFDAGRVVFTDSSGIVTKPAVTIEGGELKFVGARAGRISSPDGTTMFIDWDDPEIFMEGTV